LALAARQRRSYVTHEREVLHRCANDVGMHLCRYCGGNYMLHVEIGIEPRDIIGDRTGELR
jgi:hypothetical protein